MSEDDILKKFKELNNLSKDFEFRKNIEGTKFNLYLIPSWMSNLSQDIWISGRFLSSKLKEYGLTNQLYYDIMELRIGSIDERPKCANDLCNNTCNFYGLLRGYGNTCSKSCGSRVSDLNPIKNKILRDKFTKSRLGSRNSDHHNKLLSECRKGRKMDDSIKTRLSNVMLKKYEDPNEILKRIKSDKPSRIKRGWIKVNKCKEDIYYGSSWEKYLIELCDRSDKVKSIYRCSVIKYEYEGKNKRYLPDLLVELTNGNYILFEVKPSKNINDPIVQAKAKAAISWCNSLGNYEYRFFSEIEMKMAKKGKYVFY